MEAAGVEGSIARVTVRDDRESSRENARHGDSSRSLANFAGTRRVPTLADIIEHRVTHAKAKRSAFDGYDRGAHWEATCREVAKLRVQRKRVSASVVALVR